MECVPAEHQVDWNACLQIMNWNGVCACRTSSGLERVPANHELEWSVCLQIMDNLDLSDMSELLYKGAKRATISNWACYEEGTACRNKPPPVPEAQHAGTSPPPPGA
eukprot:1158546-Pelagomonas_calceolata.AAC.1